MFCFENFFIGTYADWVFCEIPDRKPDFVSFTGSAYWNYGNRVRRLSDHWGIVKSCHWLIDNKSGNYFVCGECLYENFVKIGRFHDADFEAKSSRHFISNGSMARNSRNFTAPHLSK